MKECEKNACTACALTFYGHGTTLFGFFGGVTTCSPRTVNVHAPATLPKRLSSPSSPIGKLCAHCSCRKVVRRVKMLLIDPMWPMVKLNYSLNRHMEYVRQILYENPLFNLLVWAHSGSPQKCVFYRWCDPYKCATMAEATNSSWKKDRL